MLALHFWAWNASVSLTTVSASVVLVNMQPAIVALFSAVWLREPPSRRNGWNWHRHRRRVRRRAAGRSPRRRAHTAVRCSATFSRSREPTAAFYFVAGRRLRETLDLWPYVALVYGTCFVVLLVFAAASTHRCSDSRRARWRSFCALAIGPMLLGHTGLNWALKYLPAYVVNLTLLGEPVGATLLAAICRGFARCRASLRLPS